MRLIHTSLILTSIVALGFTGLTACVKSTPQPELPTLETQTQIESTPLGAPGYPSSPEDVVSTFLAVYPSTPVEAIRFLSPGLVSKLSESTALSLLPSRIEITGFTIKQGATNVEMESSAILVDVGYQNGAREVTFNLIIVDGRWMINTISAQ
jgi:hypothetical protein